MDEFDIKEGEFEEMEETHTRLSNSEELIEMSQSVLDLLSDDNSNADSLIYNAIRYLEDLVDVDVNYQSSLDMLNEALIQVQEASSEVRALADSIEQDPELLAELDERISRAMFRQMRYGNIIVYCKMSYKNSLILKITKIN